MRAVVFHRYGSPIEVMELDGERQVPEPKADEVLVKVECASINAADRHMVRANYLIIRMLLGLRRPSNKNQVLGMDVAGTVQAVGKDVDGFRVGDDVVADVRKSLGGGFAEYAVVKASDLVRKPPGVSFEEAATVPISGQAAMMGVTLCIVGQGDRVLVNGASGGVGSFGVQIAKAQGAHVTAVCSARKMNAVKDWGADEVVDYAVSLASRFGGNRFDAVFDAACFGSPREYSKILREDGRYVLVGGSYYNMLRVKMFGRGYGRGAQRFMALTQEVAVVTNIEKVLALISQGRIDPPIQRIVPLEEVPAAIRSLEQRDVVGKIVVKNGLSLARESERGS